MERVVISLIIFEQGSVLSLIRRSAVLAPGLQGRHTSYQALHYGAGHEMAWLDRVGGQC